MSDFELTHIKGLSHCIDDEMHDCLTACDRAIDELDYQTLATQLDKLSRLETLLKSLKGRVYPAFKGAMAQEVLH